jgi:ABC-type branched-subunit amino acid transport system substrate-binding protein/tRNA A-37 threonylcarbamoyl transferase component Bud32
MSLDPRLSDLLLAWEQARSQGQDLSAAELCRDCPELAGTLNQRIHALRQLTPVLDLAPYLDDTAPSLPAPLPLDAGSIPGCTLENELGRGGSGVVYKARQAGLDRVVAIKVLMAGAFAGEVALSRFQSEARTLAQLCDAHIVQIYHIGTVQGLPYFVLEYVDGGSLARFCDGTPLDPHEAARLMTVLARTVQHVHQAGIVHRDLKPGNVLLKRIDQADADRPEGAVQLRGQWFFPKLTDFGLARSVEDDSHLTASGMIVGTPAYMSPEQTQGSKAQVGPATDIFSLGVIFYQLLTGTLPFQADASWQVMHRISALHPVPPRSRRPDCPAELEAICLRCLEKDPAHRYGSAEALEADLGRYLRGEPIDPRQRRRAGWRRQGMAAAALVALALAVGAVLWAMAYSGDRGQDQPDRRTAARLPTNKDLQLQVNVKIGVVINLRGPRARVDQTILDGVKLAVEELSGQGDKGDRIDIVWEGGWTTAEEFQSQVRRFIVEDKVACLIGCAAPEDRKEIQGILQEHKQLLLVPARSEAIGPGSRMLCLEPSLTDLASYTAKWIAADTAKTRVLWVDDETPVGMEMGRDLAAALAALPRGATFSDRHIAAKGFDWDTLETDFKDPAARPKVLVASLHGDDLYHLYAAFKAPAPPAMLFLDVTEEDKNQFVDARELKDIYVLSTWSGMQRTKGSQLAERLGAHPEMQKRASCNTASAYAAVHLWRQAAQKAGTFQPDPVRQALAGQRFDGLGEPVLINTASGHATRVISLGQLDATGNVQRWQ